MTRTALLSVADKRGIVELAQGLLRLDFELIASGGTARQLREAGLPVTSVADVTGVPEMLGGRVKTLHPAIHGGILSRRTAADRSTLRQAGWREIDLVVVNLYPFEATIAAGASLPQAVEQIDIGGVALLRAAAKNFAHVVTLCDPTDYEAFLEEFTTSGKIGEATRRRLAAKAFARTAAYDAAIQRYLDAEDGFPDTLTLSWHKVMPLRYGENPHQRAALYAPRGVSGPLGGEQLQGKPLSYNNLLDLDAAWRAVWSFERPTVVIVKHLSPCGIASADTLAKAFPPALAGDPISAFGSVIAANRPFDTETARALGKLFIEAIIAPDFTPEALEILKRRKNCRLLAVPHPPEARLEYRSVQDGFLAQERDRGDKATWRVVTARQPTPDELRALHFAWRAVAHVKSNAIVLAQGTALTGVGGGQPSRVDAVRIAVAKAGDRAAGSVLASDAFFPFPDGVEVAAKAGVRAIVQPGGSIRDEPVIASANELGLAMVFTGYRHFRH